jgi:FlaA1/EpsC-like NDP-sugar epimerase
MIIRTKEEMLVWHDLKLILDRLEQAFGSSDQDKLRKLLIKVVPDFKPQSDITDILYDA